jgi:predicted ThiF/HesA family dinucleotide-utilizing enzyme
MKQSGLPNAIASGIAALRGVEACEVQGAPEHDVVRHCWVLEIILQIAASGRFVGEKTSWLVVLDENYPFGEMGVYPSARGSISATFQHQARNSPGPEGRRWRNGKLCLDAKFRRGTPDSTDRDPIGDDEVRLRWYVERALLWITSAALGELVKTGDPFELPERPRTDLKVWNLLRVVHDESSHSLAEWVGRLGQTGSVVLAELPGIPRVLGATEFAASSGVTVRTWEGRKLKPDDELPEGNWWLWPKPVLLSPWQVPTTWGELRRAGRAADMDVDAHLKRLAPRLRGRKGRAVQLFGYPIPREIGSDAVEICWDALLLPEVPATGVPPRGFRANNIGWWQRDRYQTFGDGMRLEWLAVENWHPDRLTARGRLSMNLCNANVVILGVGALGSRLAEHLARAGAKALTLIDAQVLTAGNICRHTTTLKDVGVNKVDAVKQRLRQISPAVEVETVDMNLSGGAYFVTDALEEFDVVVDCTASDAALASLAAGWWSNRKAFASFSLGNRARWLYSFGVVGNEFPGTSFDEAFAPWRRESLEASTGLDAAAVREGPGCWSPLFPARDDEVAMAAAACVAELESLLNKQPTSPRFRVFERQELDGDFIGFVAVSSVPNPRSAA